MMLHTVDPSTLGEPLNLKPRLCAQCGKIFRTLAGKSAARCPSCRAIRGIKRSLAGRALTQREMQLVRFVSEGCHNKEIADRVGITEGTVKVYLSRIFDKTGCESRLDLGQWARCTFYCPRKCTETPPADAS
jgi:DNA-binding NarL/FixJ family response regulator